MCRFGSGKIEVEDRGGGRVLLRDASTPPGTLVKRLLLELRRVPVSLPLNGSFLGRGSGDQGSGSEWGDVNDDEMSRHKDPQNPFFNFVSSPVYTDDRGPVEGGESVGIDTTVTRS